MEVFEHSFLLGLLIPDCRIHNSVKWFWDDYPHTHMLSLSHTLTHTHTRMHACARACARNEVGWGEGEEPMDADKGT